MHIGRRLVRGMRARSISPARQQWLETVPSESSLLGPPGGRGGGDIGVAQLLPPQAISGPTPGLVHPAGLARGGGGGGGGGGGSIRNATVMGTTNGHVLSCNVTADPTAVTQRRETD